MHISTAILAMALSCASALAAAAEGTGQLIVAIGDRPGCTSGVMLRFRSKDGRHSDFISYSQRNLVRNPREIDDGADGTGSVRVLDLAPGDWEIYEISWANTADPSYLNKYTSPDGFSIPFTVKAGEAVYIGDFQADAPTYTHASDVVMYLTNRNARDVAIAKNREAILPVVTVAVPDVEALHSPIIRFAP